MWKEKKINNLLRFLQIIQQSRAPVTVVSEIPCRGRLLERGYAVLETR